MKPIARQTAIFPLLVFPFLQYIYQFALIHMPSTLYESVKQSVIEYTQIKKRNQTRQDKLIFRWKLITLTLAIILIVLIGIFSQLLRSINNIPNVTSDKTYILPLLTTTTDRFISTITQASNLIAGITVTSDYDGEYFEWNQAQLLYTTQIQINMADLTNKINNEEELLFIFSNPALPNTPKFGFRAHKGYQLQNGAAEDNSDSRYSSFFNINTGQTLKYNQPNCNLFTKTDTTLTFFQAITLTAATSTLTFNVNKLACWGSSSLDSAQNNLASLTNVPRGSQPQTGFGLEVYKLYLIQDAPEQI